MIKILFRQLIRPGMLLILCFCTSGVFSQSIFVNGTVKDRKGEPLSGVNVTLKGSSTVRVTDNAGRFSIPANSSSSVLEFSYVGFGKIERQVGSVPQMNIVLNEQTSNLEEVVVIGFGTQKKAEQTSAISTVKAAEIVKAPVGDVTNAITGRMVGVMTRQPQGRPGASAAQIYIRGRSSLNSSALIIVDGVERESFGDIDPNDIESISTLKDAASTALFGLKGANGVIVVTTKRGRVGRTRINYSGSVGMNTFGQKPEPLRSYESAVLQNEGEDNLARIGMLTHPKYFTADDIEKFRTGGDPLLYPDVDWFDALTRDAWIRTQHNLSFSGGSQKASYYVALGYMFEDGMFKQFNTPSGYKTSPYAKRTNFRSNLDYNLTKTTKLSLNLAGRVENEYTVRTINTQLAANDGLATGAEGLFRSIYTLPSWALPFFPEYTARSTPEMIALDDTYNQIGFVGFGNIRGNPYLSLKRGGYSAGEKNVLESAFIINQQLDFVTKGLNFTGTFAYDQRSEGSRLQFGAGNIYQVDRTSKQLFNAFAPATASQYQIEDGFDSRVGVNDGRMKTSIQLNMNYTRQFGDHKMSGAIVGTREFEPVSNGAPRAFQGVVFKTAYNYLNKYFIEVNGSYQGSENYDKSYRYGFFPTVGLGYTLSEEKFMEGIKESLKLDYLKLRGSYGTVGFGNIAGRFLYLNEYGSTASAFYFGNPSAYGAGVFDPRPGANFTGGYPAGTIPVYAHTLIGNPSVTFEKSLKRNLGLDANFFKNKVQISADIFDDKRSDILTTRANSTLIAYGENTPNYNYGENYNAGIEFELKLNNRVGKNFDYGITFQFSHIKNKTIIVDEPANEPLANLRTKGNSIGQFRGYATNGFYQSEDEVNKGTKIDGFPFMPGDIKLVDQNNDGLINFLDFTNIGYSDIPQDQYSLSPYIGYKAFRLSALFQAVDKVSSEFNLNDNTVQYFPHQLDRWTPENKAAKYPAIRPGSVGGNIFYSSANNGLNEFNLQDASFIKLRNVELSCQVPQRYISRLGLASLNLSVTGQNLYTWTKFLGLDPENNDDRSVGFYVIRGVTYPNIRTFQFNLRVGL